MLRHGLNPLCDSGTSRQHSRLHARSSVVCRQMVQQQPTLKQHQQHRKLAAVPDVDAAIELALSGIPGAIRSLAQGNPDGSTGILNAIFGEDADLVRQVMEEHGEMSLPTAEELSVEMILQGMRRAEAAQQQLMTEGRLADAARQGNKGIKSLLDTHSKLQQLYHKAWGALLERYGQLAVTPGGLAYAICCDLLGASAVAAVMQEPEPVSKQPGDSISSEALKKLAAMAVASGRQQELAQLAASLVDAPSECVFVMPSLLGMMLTGPIGPPGARVQPLLTMFGKTGILAEYQGDYQDVLQSGSDLDGSLAGSNRLLQSVAELLVASFSKQPVLDLQPPATQEAFKAIVLTGKCSTMAASCVPAVLNTLPDSDAAYTVTAEVVGQRWVYEGHAHPSSDPYTKSPLEAMLLQLRIICITTAISHIACSAMLEQLEGVRPLGEWGDVIKALELIQKAPDLGEQHGWALSQALLLKLLPEEQAMKAYALPGNRDDVTGIRKQMGKFFFLDLEGFTQTYTSDVYMVPGSSQTSIKKWLDDGVVTALRQYKALLLPGKLEALDAGRGCFPFMMYWLDIQQMASQLAGGKPGPAAKAAALHLLENVPHSVVVARSALRICNMIVSQPPAPLADLLPTSIFRVHPDLQARALARGDRPLAAQILAVGKLPDAVRERAATPYHTSSSSSSNRSPQSVQAPAAAAAELLHLMIAQPGKLSSGSITKLLTAAGSASAVPQAYDPALCAALEQMLQELAQKRKHTLDDLWFVVGLLQHRLLQAAGGDADMEALLLGPGRMASEHIKPIADFFDAKKHTTDMFAQAVCNTGWRLNSKAICELAGCVFEFGTASGYGFRSSLWGFAALLSDPRPWVDDKLRANGKDAFTITSRSLSRHAWLALSDDALAAQLPAEFELLNGFHWRWYPATIDDVRMCCWVIQQLLSTSGSFFALEPAVQAYVQATAKRLVCFPGISLHMPAVLVLVATVPLLHAKDYEHVLDMPSAESMEVFGTVWAAAVAAATDLQLAATPAFGGKRPSLPWLLQLLRDSWQAFEVTAPNHLAAEGASEAACNKVAFVLLQPVVAAAKRLLQEPSNPDSITASQQLLCSVLDCLSSAPGLSYRGVVQPVMQDVLTLLQDAATAGLQLQVPQLPAALSAAVSAGAAAGDLGFLHAATEEGAASVLQLLEQGSSLLYWAGIAGSAQGMQNASCAEVCKQQLLRLWGVSVSTVDSTAHAEHAQMPKEAATEVAAALMRDAAAGGTLCEQLLNTAVLPAAVAAALLQAVCGSASAHPMTAKLAVVQQLLAHVQQHDALQQLQPEVIEATLQVLLDAAASSDASVGVPSETLSLLGAFLQSGAAVSTPTAQQVLVCMGTHPDFGQQLQSLLQQQQGMDTVPAAQVLLCALLQQVAVQAVPAQQSWGLYQLLLQLGGAQQLPQKDMLTVCSVLIQQQGGSAGTDTTPRLLQLWQQAVACAGSVAAVVEQLGREVVQHALPALVAAGEQQQALGVVELMPALLPTLAQLWQQQQQEQEPEQAAPVAIGLVVHACRLCIAAGTAEAADAAEVLLPLLQGPAGDGTASASAPAQDPAGELYTGLLQLVCKHSRSAAALEIFKHAAPYLVSELQAGLGTVAAAAVVVLVSAGSSQQQQQQLVQLLSSSEGDMVLLAQAALGAALTAPTPSVTAVALLLHALQQGGKQQLAALLQPAELDRLCALVCSSSGSSAQEQPPFKLPSVAKLAAQCTDQLDTNRPPVSAATAAILANTLAANHPYLQPSIAAAALGTILPLATAANTHGSTAPAAAPPPADAWQVSKVLAQLCFQQLLAGLSPATSSMDEDAGAVCADLEGSLAGWVPALSPAAAAAAMFAVGLHWEQLVAASAAAGAGAALPQVQTQLAEPVLVLELYQRAKSSGDSLVFDMGLAAAAEAAELTGDWHRGESIIAAAQKAFQQAGAEGSKGSSSSNSRWIPVLPAARCALLSTLVQTQGVAAAGKLLLTELEEQLGLQQQGQGRATAPMGRKGKAASGAARPAAAAGVAITAPAARLLSLPVVNSFLATAVKVAVGYQQEDLDEEAEAAARAAVEVFTENFKLQVAAVSLAATGRARAASAGTGANSLRPNADSWASLLQLHGCLGSLPQASNIVLSACRQQLPGVSSGSGLQAVLAAAAGAFNAAGKHTVAVQLLDGLVAAGVTAVSHPMLAQQLLNATEKSCEAEQDLVDRLLEGDAGLYELLDVAERQSSGKSSEQGSAAAAPAVQLVQLDAAEAMQKLTRSLRSA